MTNRLPRHVPLRSADRSNGRCSTNVGSSRATKHSPSRACPLDELPSLIALAHKVRLAWCGPEVELESLINAKSGACPEDCAFCSQSVRHHSGVDVYPFLDLDEILAAAHATRDAGATQFCIVVAVRGPEERLLRRVIDAVGAVQRETGLEVACSLGLLTDEQAGSPRGRRRAPLQPQPRSVPRAVPDDLHDAQLRRPGRDRAAAHVPRAWSCAAAGSSAWVRRSSNGSTSRSSSPSSNRAKCRSTCSIRGPGTPLDEHETLSPREALQAIALFRLILPAAWLRLAGGRERVLGELQAMGLLAGANALIVGNYLTTTGRAPEEDHALLEALGMPVADGPGEGRFIVDARGAHALPARRSIPVTAAD